MASCWPWETAATLPSARQRKALQCPRGRRGAGAYRGSRRPTACLNVLTVWQKCDKFKSCAKAGLHCHHPRNCLFYLRDRDVRQLQKLLQASVCVFVILLSACSSLSEDMMLRRWRWIGYALRMNHASLSVTVVKTWNNVEENCGEGKVSA